MRGAWCVAIAACATGHVELESPRPDLSGDERVATFEQLKPIDETVQRLSVNGGPWQTMNRSLVLANHAEVYAPEDLLPVVGADSETARAAQRSVEARGKQRSWSYVALGAAVGGFMLAGWSFEGGPVSPWIAFPVFLVGPVVAYGFARHYGGIELDERRAAFEHYTRDLGDRLNVCAHGTEVVPCDGPPEKATAPGRTASLRFGN